MYVCALLCFWNKWLKEICQCLIKFRVKYSFVFISLEKKILINLICSDSVTAFYLIVFALSIIFIHSFIHLIDSNFDSFIVLLYCLRTRVYVRRAFLSIYLMKHAINFSFRRKKRYIMSQ